MPLPSLHFFDTAYFLTIYLTRYFRSLCGVPDRSHSHKLFTTTPAEMNYVAQTCNAIILYTTIRTPNPGLVLHDSQRDDVTIAVKSNDWRGVKGKIYYAIQNGCDVNNLARNQI